jgi:hypothetical protein
MALRMVSEGLVTVSERKSINTGNSLTCSLLRWFVAFGTVRAEGFGF